MRINSLSVAASMLALLAMAIAGSPPTDAQVKCKVDRVGKTFEDMKVGVEPELWALIIGVSTYKRGGERVGLHTIPNLQYASDDADAIYDFLRSDRGGGFREDRIRLLKDEDATKAGVEAAFAWLKQARPDDYFVVFIASHGAIDRNPDPKTGTKLPYFVLYDTDPGDLKGTGIEMTVLRRLVENDLPRKGLVLADTCHSAGVTLLDGTNLSVPANDDFIKQMELLPKAVGYISAAYQTESSYEKDELYHGVFTYCLLEALRGEADQDHNQIVTFDEVVKYLFAEVPGQTGEKQHIYPATNNLDANCLPLSIARYGCPGGDCGTVVIRNPDLDGVEYRVGAGTSERLARNVETTLRLKPGQNEISFFKSGAKNKTLPVQVQPGETAEINVKLAFSNIEEASGSNFRNRQYDLYLVEESDAPDAVKKSFESGVESFDKQRFEEAVGKLGRAGDYHPALVYRGRAEQALGQYETAISSFTKAVGLRPSDYETETLLAEAKFDLAKTKPDGKAEIIKVSGDLKKIIRRYPKYDFARVVLGDVLFYLGNKNGAERELRHAIAIRPASPPAHMILADILSSQPLKSKREEAIKEAETSLQLFRELSTKKVTFKRLSLSHLIFGGGRYVNEAALSEASYILGKAIVGFVEAYPDNPDRARNLARAGAALDEARRLAEGIKARLRQALVMALISQRSILSGDAAGAITAGKQALALSDSTANPSLKGYIHNTLSQAYENNQDYCKAAEHQRDLIKVFGTSLNQERQRQADERLAKLTSMAEARRLKCKL